MDDTICLEMIMAAAATAGIAVLSTHVCRRVASELIIYDGEMKSVTGIRPRTTDMIVDYVDNFGNKLTFIYDHHFAGYKPK